MPLAKIKYSFKKAYIQITTSISFYPILITVGLISLSFGISYLDNIGVGEALMNKVPFLKIDNPNTARSLLSSFLTGLISLVTFMFAMVMIVLSQITSSFSPRLLPDLVSKKGNQIVLGVIIGSICFIAVAISNIETLNTGPKVPLLSVEVGMILGFASVISFIYFIHKISNEIQIGNILNSRYRITRDALDKELNSGTYYHEWKEQEEFTLVNAWDSGYFDTVTTKEFLKSSKKHQLKIRLLKHQGMYLLKGEPFLEINQPLTDTIQEVLEENVIIRHQENVDENIFYGFKHLTEIAVKALSPAVNDPGTAIHAVDYLSDLLCRLQQLKGQKVVRHEDGTASIIYLPIPYENIFYLCTASIRAYSTQDVTLQGRLIDLIHKLSRHDEENKYKDLYEMSLVALEEGSEKEMKSQADILFVKELVQKARKEL
ncbi:DUF2254 domain-containing protein [Rufibacter roseus]|uniref:DUF2254 domain-containing protein n=1 Tax=Rufibacter roseus TaxID=1567108 RepID=A0ABW2DP63_9BACT|nr:DUF2254 domain-containing protein [Rufibacter roseus]